MITDAESRSSDFAFLTGSGSSSPAPHLKLIFYALNCKKQTNITNRLSPGEAHTVSPLLFFTLIIVIIFFEQKIIDFIVFTKEEQKITSMNNRSEPTLASDSTNSLLKTNKCSFHTQISCSELLRQSNTNWSSYSLGMSRRR